MRNGVILFCLATTLAPAQTPAVNPDGVVNAASFAEPVAPGSLVSIFGSNLASQTAQAAAIPLPMSLSSVSVSFNGVAAPLIYVSAGQINAQLPWQVPPIGPVSVTVRNNGVSSAPQAVQVGPYSPAVFTSAGQAVTTGPVVSDDTISIFATGLGPVDPAGVTGDNSLDALRRTTMNPVVSIGGVQARVTFSGLSPQFVGVYQINADVPPNLPPGDALPVRIQIGGVMSGGLATVVTAAPFWPQWGQNPQRTGSVQVPGQDLSRILANIVYDPLTPEEQAAENGDLTGHFQVPLVDGNDVYMEFKTGTFDANSYASETWGESRFTWENGQLVPVWSYTSDWKAPGSTNDFWEPVFHPALANGALYVPGANGSLIKVDKATGTPTQRFSPFGADPNTYETGPVTVDAGGNVFYNAIQVTVDPVNGFYANDASDSWLVKIAPDGSISTASYKTLTSSDAPAGNAQCLTSFRASSLPWPPSATSVPVAQVCGTQRAGLNAAPAIAPDGTIYSITRSHFNNRYGFLVAINPDLTKKWVVSLRDRFNDGCGVAVSAGGWLPANGAPGGCRAGTTLGVDPATNRPGAGLVDDDASSSPVVAPDGSVLYGAYSRYNYAQGHLMRFDADGNYLGAFGFGWDYTPAIYAHDGTWSILIKDNHYGGVGSYCDDDTICPPDRNTTNPASPEEYLVSQLSPALNVEWSFRNTNTESCTRNPDGSLSCVSDHPSGFEWCVNAPVVDANGTLYANSEDGNLYAISQGGTLKQKIFQQLALGAAYTPASIGGDGKIYTQNDGHLFVAGK